jgi:hypothetical protein
LIATATLASSAQAPPPAPSMISDPRKALLTMTTIKLLLAGIIMALATTADAAPLRYVGRAYSNGTGGTLRYRVVLTPTSDPTIWTGFMRCRSLTPYVRCLARYNPIAVEFDLEDGSFYAQTATGCEAGGPGTPYSPLSGSYRCGTIDSGAFYLRRVYR